MEKRFSSIKTVIALVGGGDTGKSTALRTLAQTSIKWDDRTKVVARSKGCDWTQKNDGDFRVAGTVDGIRIGIATGGDDADTIMRSFLYFSQIEIQCEIVIVAVHPQRGSRSDSISWWALHEIVGNNGITLIEVDKKSPTDEDSERATREILNNLEHEIGKMKGGKK